MCDSDSTNLTLYHTLTSEVELIADRAVSVHHRRALFRQMSSKKKALSFV